MFHLGSYLIERMNNGDWKITHQGATYVIHDIGHIFDTFFYPQRTVNDFIVFFRRMHALQVEELLKDQECMDILALCHHTQAPDPEWTNRQHLIYLINGWISGFNAYYNSNVAISQVIDHLIKDFQ